MARIAALPPDLGAELAKFYDPPESVLKTLFLLKPLPAPIKQLEGRLWAQLKSGG